MLARALGVAVVLGATCCVPAAKGPATEKPTPEALASALADESVALYEAKPFCSGVWVSSTEFVTADHCAQDSGVGDEVSYVVPRDVVEIGDEVRISDVRGATFAALDEDHDLALVRAIAPPPHRVATFSAREIVPGARVFAMGTPLEQFFSFSAGDVSRVGLMASGDLATRYVQATAPVSPGSSGCGLFDDEGNLIGIARGILVQGESLNFFVHRDAVRAFLERAGVR